MRRGLSVFALVVLSACATPAPRSEVPPITSPHDLARRMQERRASVRDAETRSTLSMEIDGVRQKARGVIFYRRPDTLRLEVTALTGSGLLSALFTGDSVAVYLPRENEAITGRSHTVLRGITGLEFGYYDLPDALLGLADFHAAHLDRLTAFTSDDRHYRLSFALPFGRRDISVDRRSLHVVDDRITDTFGELLSRRRSSGEAGVPSSVQIIQGGNQLSIQHTRLDVNTGLVGRRFDRVVPAGAKKTPATEW